MSEEIEYLHLLVYQSPTDGEWEPLGVFESISKLKENKEQLIEEFKTKRPTFTRVRECFHIIDVSKNLIETKPYDLFDI